MSVCRYVERTALSANLVQRAEEWRWSSLWLRQHGSPGEKLLLHPWPIGLPADWLKRVNSIVTPKELSRWQDSLSRSRPFGHDTWVGDTARKLGLQHTIRGEGGRHANGKEPDAV